MALYFEYWFLDLVLLLVTLLTLLYGYFKYNYTYWKRRGVPSMTPTFPCGNFQDVFLFRRPVCEVFVDIYNHFEGEKVGGYYQLHKPTIMLRDLDIVKHVLVKEFSKFRDRGIYFDEKNDVLRKHLFAMGSPGWRPMRSKLAPTFTSGKMRMMFSTVLECGGELGECLEGEAGEGAVVEMQEVLARYTTDVIASCAFGIRCNCLKDPEAEFRKHGRNVFRRDLRGSLGMFLNFYAPPLAALTKLGNTPREISDFFGNAVRETVTFREKNHVTRNDFMQLLIQLKEKGFVDGEEPAKDTDRISMNDVAAQAFVFFAAGFETSSATMAFCLHELAVNPDIQTRLQHEIDSVLAKHEGRVTYDGMAEMELLDQVVAETLRMYPPLPGLNRECNATCALPGTSIVLEPGSTVIVPVYAIHRDPRHYPHPHVFDPHRFTKEEKAKRHPYAYLPFGEGPRICIGLRFGLMQVKVGLISLLRSYEFRVSSRTAVPVVIDPTLLLLGSKGGIHLQIVKRAN